MLVLFLPFEEILLQRKAGLLGLPGHTSLSFWYGAELSWLEDPCPICQTKFFAWAASTYRLVGIQLDSARGQCRFWQSPSRRSSRSVQGRWRLGAVGMRKNWTLPVSSGPGKLGLTLDSELHPWLFDGARVSQKASPWCPLLRTVWGPHLAHTGRGSAELPVVVRGRRLMATKLSSPLHLRHGSFHIPVII